MVIPCHQRCLLAQPRPRQTPPRSLGSQCPSSSSLPGPRARRSARCSASAAWSWSTTSSKALTSKCFTVCRVLRMFSSAPPPSAGCDLSNLAGRHCLQRRYSLGQSALVMLQYELYDDWHLQQELQVQRRVTQPCRCAAGRSNMRTVTARMWTGPSCGSCLRRVRRSRASRRRSAAEAASQNERGLWLACDLQHGHALSWLQLEYIAAAQYLRNKTCTRS